MKKFLGVRFGVLSFVLLALPVMGGDYPSGPDPVMTPGTLCTHPDSRRYPEKIPYCKRDVSSAEKKQIFKHYDEARGFRTRELPRDDFKIDHYIPLCMGGSNDERNLWPQHESIYVLTDRSEDLLCQHMEAGIMSQSEAVATIRELKAHPETGPELAARLERELRGPR